MSFHSHFHSVAIDKENGHWLRTWCQNSSYSAQRFNLGLASNFVSYP